MKTEGNEFQKMQALSLLHEEILNRFKFPPFAAGGTTGKYKSNLSTARPIFETQSKIDPEVKGKG